MLDMVPNPSMQSQVGFAPGPLDPIPAGQGGVRALGSNPSTEKVALGPQEPILVYRGQKGAVQGPQDPILACGWWEEVVPGTQ